MSELENVTWEYNCPSDDHHNRFAGPPVPNVVRCYHCGDEMEVYAEDNSD